MTTATHTADSEQESFKTTVSDWLNRTKAKISSWIETVKNWLTIGSKAIVDTATKVVSHAWKILAATVALTVTAAGLFYATTYTSAVIAACVLAYGVWYFSRRPVADHPETSGVEVAEEATVTDGESMAATETEPTADQPDAGQPDAVNDDQRGDLQGQSRNHRKDSRRHR